MSIADIDILEPIDSDYGVYSNAFYSAMKPNPLLTVSEWSDKYRYLSPESSPEPGKWATKRTPYLKDVMDALNDPSIDTIVIMASAQVGKTEVLLNICGYYMHQDPSPILLVLPTVEVARDFSKRRVRPMFRDTAVLKQIVGGENDRSRDPNNTIRDVIFPGGSLSLVGANSPSGLASKPIKVVLCDEVDRYDDTREGDPLELASKRTSNFFNRKLIYVSTPTDEGLSMIEHWYNHSDQRKYYVPCQKCGEFQILEWGRVKWDRDDRGLAIPDSAQYFCGSCLRPWTNKERIVSLGKGEWRKTAENERFKGVAGFHLNELYSPWSTPARMAASFVKATETKNAMKLREFINLSLGEVWEEKSVTIGENSLYDRREDYGGFEVPEDVVVMTAGVDIQNDRIECEIVGWGDQEESWGIDYFVIPGNTSTMDVYNDLYRRISRPYTHESGVDIAVMCTCIDSGDGNYTDMVYRFCRYKEMYRIFSVKGSSVYGKPLTSRPSRGNKFAVPLYSVGTDTAKSMIYNRLTLESPGAGYMHFPQRYDMDYFKQLTSEKQVIKPNPAGRPERKWVVKSGRRNEALDCRVYASAALSILDIKWDIYKNSTPISGKYHTLEEINVNVPNNRRPGRRGVKRSGKIW